jgi:hypothetical protein
MFKQIFIFAFPLIFLLLYLTYSQMVGTPFIVPVNITISSPLSCKDILAANSAQLLLGHIPLMLTVLGP